MRPSSPGYEEGSGIVVRDFEQIRRNYLLGAFSTGPGRIGGGTSSNKSNNPSCSANEPMYVNKPKNDF